jgi:predicted Zn-dependent protease
MEAALRYMLAEYLCEVGRWDEASDELDLNLARLHVTGIPALFSWGYLARLAAWRGDTIRADEALTRTRSLTELAPQQPLPLASALSGRVDSLLWTGWRDAPRDCNGDCRVRMLTTFAQSRLVTDDT